MSNMLEVSYQTIQKSKRYDKFDEVPLFTEEPLKGTSVIKGLPNIPYWISHFESA
jgi:hypothetical protein